MLEDEMIGTAPEGGLLRLDRVGRIGELGDALVAVGRVVGCGQDREHAGTRARRLDPDRPNARMRMRRAQHIGEARIRRGNVVGIAAAAGDEALVLQARYRLADETRHQAPSRPREPGRVGVGVVRV